MQASVKSLRDSLRGAVVPLSSPRDGLPPHEAQEYVGGTGLNIPTRTPAANHVTRLKDTAVRGRRTNTCRGRGKPLFLLTIDSAEQSASPNQRGLPASPGPPLWAPRRQRTSMPHGSGAFRVCEDRPGSGQSPRSRRRPGSSLRTSVRTCNRSALRAMRRIPACAGKAGEGVVASRERATAGWCASARTSGQTKTPESQALRGPYCLPAGQIS